MSDLNRLPLQDNFETVLTQEWDGNVGTVFLANVPNFTFPAGETTLLIISPGTSNAQLAEIDSIDAINNTVNVSNILNLELAEGVASTAQIHSTNSRVLISDNFQFWKDIKTAINSKLNSDGDSTIGSGFRLNFGADAYISTIDNGTNLLFKDGSNPEINLSTLAAAAGADTKVAASVADTTTGTLDEKVVPGNGVARTINNPGASETFQIDIDTTDTNTFVKTSSGASDEDKAMVLDANGQFDQGFIPGNINGLKTFDTIPQIPTTTPTLDAEVSSKKYVDDSIAALDAFDRDYEVVFSKAAIGWAGVTNQTGFD